ncbi:TatD family hydrolase [Marinobacter sp. NFXS11]|uniref:TatD family hydrolase n=1 Tax=Marinobacter sp. NFXS11 TaxID=2818432 RepID=UPI0032DF8F65
MRLIDAHCHFDFPQFDDRRDNELEQGRSRGLSGLVIPGVRRPDWDRVRDTALAHEGLFYCLGIHPWFVEEHSEADLAELRRRLEGQPECCLGIGECGLDRLKGNLERQWPWFEAQVDLARELNLPLVIHSVKTHDEVHGLLNRRQWHGRALIHGFSGSFQQAAKLVDLGCFIGVGGVITHPRARKTRDAIARLPLKALVLETDAPDMAPEGVPQGENSPRYLPDILDALAELRGASPEQLAPALLDNVSRLYGWATAGIGE